MQTIISIGLWAVGLVFFLFSFSILAICLVVCPREITFSLARRLFSMQIRVMGIRLRVKGRGNIDPDQTYLIMGNHESLFDLFVIPAAIPLTFTGVEAAYHFKIPIWGHLIRKWGCIPIQRYNLAQAKKSLEQARTTLDEGLSIVILPEGHRTRTGEMAAFKKGPFHLAKATRATILPFGISGLFEFQQRGEFYLNPRKVYVKIDEAIPYESYKDLSVEEFRDLIFNRIHHLSQ